MTQALEKSHDGLRRLREFSLSARAWVEQNFTNDFVRAVMLNWALAPLGDASWAMLPIAAALVVVAIRYFGSNDLKKGGT